MIRRPIFDAATAAGADFNKRGAVATLDTALDMLGVPRDDIGTTDTILTPSPACAALVQSFEGCHKKRSDGYFEAYPDPGSGGDPWTIGWGSTGPEIKRGTIWTQAQCDARFAEHLAEFGAKVADLIRGAPTTQSQFDAMTSLAYNVGTGNFGSSTLLRKHRAGDYEGAAGQFGVWNRASGKIMAGLTRRRAAEAAMYRGQP